MVQGLELTLLLMALVSGEPSTAVFGGTTVISLSSHEITEHLVNIPESFHRGRQQNVTFLWRVYLELEEAYEDKSSLQVSLQHGSTTKNFRLPYTRVTSTKKNTVTGALGRTVDLCPTKSEPVGPSSQLRVRLVSTSVKAQTVRLTTSVVVDGEDWKNKSGLKWELHGNLSLASPLVRSSAFQPPRDTKYVELRIESSLGSDCFCSIVSVQQPQCPYFDSISTATRFGTWQTIAENTSMILRASNFPDGFLIAVAAAEHDGVCNFVKTNCTEVNKGSPRAGLRKHLRITMEGVAGNKTRLEATFALVGLYLIIMLLALGLSAYQFRYDYQLFQGHTVVSIVPIIAYAGSIAMMQVDNQAVNDADTTDRTSESKEKKRDSKMGTKVRFYLSNLSHKLSNPTRSRSVYKKDKLYISSFLLMSIFYSIAVLQLAFRQAAKYRSEGNFDICYFNSRCQVPLGPFLDFNHFLSNLGYAVFGIIFIGIVYMKQRRFESLLNTGGPVMEEALEAQLKHSHGVPQQCGIFYTMGGALAMEGLMSASYHVCPTTISFQFDTTFMYLIAILIYIKIYQNRHPDISLNASTAFLILGVALILEAFSIYFSTATFWVIFCLIYMFSLVCLVSNAYELNTVRRGEGGGGKKGSTIIRVAKLLASETLKAGRKIFGRKVPKVRNLLVFIAVTCLLNIAMCIFFAVKAGVGSGENASNYLLMMFMANMGIYVLYYIVMKKISNEQLCKQAKLYLGKNNCKLLKGLLPKKLFSGGR